LVGGERRRVRGLRREEVAVLANVSSTWYTELEQGRHVRPTIGVLDAIARGLRMTRDEHDYLRSLGGHPPTAGAGLATVSAVQRRLIIDLPYPAVITTPWFDYLAWNPLFVALMCFDPESLPAKCRNPLYLWTVSEHSSLRVEDHDGVQQSLVARLRFEYIEYGDHPGFRNTIERLCAASEEFRSAWLQHEVRRSMDVGPIVIDHPSVGLLELRPVRLIFQDQPMLRIGTYFPVNDATQQRLSELNNQPLICDAYSGPLEGIFAGS
jgi:hypothetical protein